MGEVMIPSRSRILLAEALGTAFLLAGVVGSGIMAARLSPNDVGLQLLQNAVATAGVLVAIISIFGTISADFNPAVTLGAWVLGHRPGRDVVPMVAAQVVGAVVGTVVANLMWWPPISVRRTTSLRRPVLPTRRSPWVGRSVTPSLGSIPRVPRCSS